MELWHVLFVMKSEWNAIECFKIQFLFAHEKYEKSFSKVGYLAKIAQIFITALAAQNSKKYTKKPFNARQARQAI